MEGDLDEVGLVARGQDCFYLSEKLGRQINVEGGAGGLIVEVGVWLEIRTVAGGLALEVYLADEIALHEGFEAVVNRGEGDGRQVGTNPGVNLVGGRVVATLVQGPIDDFALGGITQTTVLQAFGKVGGLVFGVGAHGKVDWEKLKRRRRERESF